MIGAAAAAVTIDFNDGVNGSDVGAFYSSLGVSFSNAEWNDLAAGYAPDPLSTGLRLVADGANLQPKLGSPIVATFTIDIYSASIIANSVNANGARVVAYDSVSGGNVVDAHEVIGISGNTSATANFTLNVSGSGIRRLEFFQPRSVESEGVLFDNLTFDTVPEPSSMLLLGIGSLSVLRLRRR